MINQPWKNKNWFTFQKTTRVKFLNDGSERFSLTGTSPNYQIFNYSFIEGSKQTIDLTQVLGWETLPTDSNERNQTFGIEAIKVYLSGPITTITLINQTYSPTKKLWEWNAQYKRYDSLGPVTISRPKMTQIDDFFDAMRDAKLL
jgi:hypothetical protein